MNYAPLCVDFLKTNFDHQIKRHTILWYGFYTFVVYSNCGINKLFYSKQNKRSYSISLSDIWKKLIIDRNFNHIQAQAE